MTADILTKHYQALKPNILQEHSDYIQIEGECRNLVTNSNLIGTITSCSSDLVMDITSAVNKLGPTILP